MLTQDFTYQTLNCLLISYFSQLIFIYYLFMPSLQLTISQLQANLPLEDSEVFVLLNPNDGMTSLPQTLNCPPSDECVLMPEVAEITLAQREFKFEVENLQNLDLYELYVLAVSNSNSKIVFLGSVVMDVLQLYNSSFQNGQSLQYKKSLENVQNQKGFITFEVGSIYPTEIEYLKSTHKSSESLDKEETSSSDSFDANLKELNRTIDSDRCNSSPNNKNQFQFYNQRNPDISEKIIVEEIDLQDSQDDYHFNKKSGSNFNSNQTINKTQQKSMYLKQKNHKKYTKERLRQQKLNIQRYLHGLQESDYFLLNIQQKLRYFKQ